MTNTDPSSVEYGLFDLGDRASCCDNGYTGKLPIHTYIYI